MTEIVSVLERIQSMSKLLCNLLWCLFKQDLHYVLYVVTTLNKQFHLTTYNKPFIQSMNVKSWRWGGSWLSIQGLLWTFKDLKCLLNWINIVCFSISPQNYCKALNHEYVSCTMCSSPTFNLCLTVFQTDSGSPLVSLKDGVWWLVGDSIWGEHCAEQNKPGVYGNITHFLDWIHRQMKVKTQNSKINS